MSIRHGLLALLEGGPRYGYQLRAAFEESTGSVWPLNIGQVYTTLARLERDGLIRALPEEQGGQRPYQLTEAGAAELVRWFTTPVTRTDRPRDELAIKLGLAVSAPGVDIRRVIQVQRTATVRAMQEYTRLKSGPANGPADLAWQLVLDKMIFQAEAEVRWLDHCEVRLTRHAALAARPAAPDQASPATAPGVTDPPGADHPGQQTDPAEPGADQTGPAQVAR